MTITTNISGNYAAVSPQNDGTFNVYFGYYAGSEMVCTNRKNYKTESSANISANKYLS